MIVGVAIRLSDGSVFAMDKPARHHELFQKFPSTRGTPLDAQGFVDEGGQFYRRRAAEMHARTCGQLTKPCIGSILTSEDLW